EQAARTSIPAARQIPISLRITARDCHSYTGWRRRKPLLLELPAGPVVQRDRAEHSGGVVDPVRQELRCLAIAEDKLVGVLGHVVVEVAPLGADARQLRGWHVVELGELGL